jgi:hypothetical protein
MSSIGSSRASIVILETPIDHARKKLIKTTFFGLFIIISSLLVLAEAILVGFPSHGIAFNLQVFVLVMSTIFFFVGIVLPFSALKSTSFGRADTPSEKLAASFDKDARLEIICLIFGWIFIFQSPGYATLRALRILRYFSYMTLYDSDDDKYYEPDYEKVITISKYTVLGQNYLYKLAREIGSQASRGGLVILAMYLYVAYLFGVLAYNVNSALSYDDDSVSDYQSLNDCFLLMLRLTLFDDKGFNYLSFMIGSGRAGYAIILFGFMIFASFILLNSLIGVFMNNSLFKRDIIENDKKKKKKKRRLPEQSRLLDDDDDDEEEDDKLSNQIQVELQLLKREIQSVKKILNAPAFDSGFTLLEWKVADVKKFL